MFCWVLVVKVYTQIDLAQFKSIKLVLVPGPDILLNLFIVVARAEDPSEPQLLVDLLPDVGLDFVSLLVGALFIVIIINYFFANFNDSLVSGLLFEFEQPLPEHGYFS